MKIDVRVMCKKIGFIFLVLGFLTIVENAVSKSSVNRTSNMRQPLPVYSVPVKTIAVDVTEPVVEQESLQFAGDKLSLEQIHALAQEQSKGAVATRLIKDILTIQPTFDRFTQSQAHMSLPEIKKLIAAKYDIKPYQKMIDAIIEREQQYKDDYYVFYHGMDNEWRVPQDLYTRLYLYSKKLPESIMQHFTFLRFEDVAGPSGVQNFLINKLEEGGLINDHELRNFLYATNVALFGNVGVDPECTWQYFIKSRGHTFPDRATYEKILDTWRLSHAYINDLMALADFYTTKEETIIQLFIPKDRVDEVGYISWIRGIPAHKKTMDMVLRSVEDKEFPKTAPALDYYTKLFRDEQESNVVFSSLLERVKAGDFSLSYFLKFYRNHPEQIEGINNFQARLILTSDLILNPLSGVKIFRYSAAMPEQLKKYQQKFDEVFKKIVANPSIHPLAGYSLLR